jgi:hypothetical protein
MGAGARAAWANIAVTAAVAGWTIAVLATGLGCKGGEGDAEAAKQALAQSEDITKQEDSLLSRRDALVKARQRIRDERDKLDEQRRAAIAAGGDTTEIDTQARALLDEEKTLVDEEEALNQRYVDIMRQRRQMLDALASSGAGATVDKTALIAGRERTVAEREKELADREQELAAREAAFAKREAQMCGIAAQPTTIIKTVDAKGSSYTKNDVEPLLKKARSYMSKKGIRHSDLPEPAQDLEKEATSAMSEGDYGRARFAANQLVNTVKSIKVNKAFIQAKIGRLNAAIQGKSLSGSKRSSVDKLFRSATENTLDGKFGSANKQLNQIYSMID